jgi:hypothetical protein
MKPALEREAPGAGHIGSGAPSPGHSAGGCPSEFEEEPQTTRSLLARIDRALDAQTAARERVRAADAALTGAIWRAHEGGVPYFVIAATSPASWATATWSAGGGSRRR